MNERYDDKSGTLWISSHLGGDDLIDNEEIQGWIDCLKAGRTTDGRDLKRVNYVFSEQDAAEYNHHALKFARIGTYTGTLEKPEALDEDDVDFTTKEDFGV